MTDPAALVRTAPAAGARILCEGVVHVYQVAGTDTAALRGVELSVEPGEQLALLGPSGSGKSTLLSVLAGLRQPSAGRVLIDGADIARAGSNRLRRYRADTTGLVLQGAATNLLPDCSIVQNCVLATRSARRPLPDDLVDRLGSLGLADRLDEPVGRWSPAHQQLAALLVALAKAPRLLLADEPTSRLDDAQRDQALRLLTRTARERGSTVVVVTHDPSVSRHFGRMVHLRGGRVGEEATPHQRFAVVGADGSVQLTEEMLLDWPVGSRVRLVAVGADEIRLRRAGSVADAAGDESAAEGSGD